MQKDVHSHTQILQERNNRLGKQDNEINQFFVNVGLQNVIHSLASYDK